MYQDSSNHDSGNLLAKLNLNQDLLAITADASLAVHHTTSTASASALRSLVFFFLNDVKLFSF